MYCVQESLYFASLGLDINNRPLYKVKLMLIIFTYRKKISLKKISKALSNAEIFRGREKTLWQLFVINKFRFLVTLFNRYFIKNHRGRIHHNIYETVHAKFHILINNMYIFYSWRILSFIILAKEENKYSYSINRSYWKK